MQKESFVQGVIFMILSVIGLALTGLLGKFGLKYMDLTALIFWRFATSFLLCSLLLWWAGVFKHGIHVTNIKMHVFRAFFVLGTQYCYYFYLEKNSLLNAMVLLNTGPLFIPIIEWLVLRHKVGMSTWISVIIAFIGVLFVLQPDVDLFSKMSVIGLLAGIMQAASQIVFGMNSTVERSDLGVFYLFSFCSLFSVVPFLFFGTTYPSFDVKPLWMICGLIGALGLASLFNQLFRTVAYQHARPSRLASFMYIAVLLGGLWDWMFFNNIPNVFSILGAVLVVFGGFFKLYVSFRKL